MSKQSFTLIELIIVMALIGILATAGIFSFTASFKSARDGKRKADLEQIRSAIELYRSNNGTYPAVSNNCSNIPGISDYLNPIPVDPKTSEKYIYYCKITADDYKIYAALESVTTSCGDADCVGGACCHSAGGAAICSYRVGPYGKLCGP